MSGRRKYPGAAPPNGPATGAANGGPSSFATTDPQHLAGAAFAADPSAASMGYPNNAYPPTMEMAGMSIAAHDPRAAPGAAGRPSASTPEIGPWTNNPSPSSGTDHVNLTAYVPEQANLSCPPEFLRLTMGIVPQSQELLNSTQVPFGAIIHPLAESIDNPVRASFSLRIQKSPFLRFYGPLSLTLIVHCCVGSYCGG